MHDRGKVKNIVIITPVYNDWESFTKLIKEIDKSVSSFKDKTFKLIAINDGSQEKLPSLSLPSRIETIEIRIEIRIANVETFCNENYNEIQRK